MEDLSRFTGPVGRSSRLAAYRARLTGGTNAQAGLAAALTRNSASLAARTMPAVTTAKAKANATNAKPHDRVKVVAHALETDPALKGKAEAALCFLADPAFAGVTGQGVIKLLKAGATTEPPKLATTTTKATTAPKRSDALGGGHKPTKASTSAWAKVIGEMNARNGFK